MNERNRIIVLVDFFEHSENLVDLAFRFSETINATFVLAHQIPGGTPAMTDQETREEILKVEAAEAHARLRKLARGRVYSDQAFHVSQKPMVSLIKELASEHFLDWVFTGLKDTGLLKRLFIGTTTLSVAKDSGLITVAVAARNTLPVPKKLMVGISPNYPLNKSQFDTVLTALKDQITEIEFFTIHNEDEDESKLKAHLSDLQKEYGSHNPDIQLYRGNNAHSLLKSRVELTEDSFLVLQQGSRSLSDKLFRTFLVDELVYDAQIPLIVLSR